MEFLGNVARKTGDASLLRVEAEKSRRAARIGAKSGLFRVPQVVGLDSDAGVLDFERLPELITFGQMVACDHPAREELVARLGRALARVHLELQLEDFMRVSLPASWMTDGERDVFLHGDFTANNVCVDTGRIDLVIVDWSAAPMAGRNATIGPRSFDVICFVRHLMMSAPWPRTLTWPAGLLCTQFMRAYVDEYGALFDPSVWQQHLIEINKYSRSAVRSRVLGTPLLRRPGKVLAQLALQRRWHAFRPPPEVFTLPTP